MKVSDVTCVTDFHDLCLRTLLQSLRNGIWAYLSLFLPFPDGGGGVTTPVHFWKLQRCRGLVVESYIFFSLLHIIVWSS